MGKLISIVVPVYNVERYIKDCLDSIKNQTYLNIEVILVDDGSTDKSGLICDDYATKDNRFTVIHKTNGGLSDARNVGITYAKGEFLLFIDSDDVVCENYVEYLYEMLVQTGAEIGICDPVHCYPRKKVVFMQETLCRIFETEEAICEMLYQKSFLVSAWGKIFYRDFFDEINFPFGMLFEDSAVMYKIFDKAKKVAYGNAKLYGYMHHEDSITTKQFSIRDCDILTICHQIDDYFSERSQKLKNAALSYHVSAALRIYLNAPKDNKKYETIIRMCTSFINLNGKKVLKDKSVRKKNKYALLLYFYIKPIMPMIYKKVNRWE